MVLKGNQNDTSPILGFANFDKLGTEGTSAPSSRQKWVPTADMLDNLPGTAEVSFVEKQGGI